MSVRFTRIKLIYADKRWKRILPSAADLRLEHREEILFIAKSKRLKEFTAESAEGAEKNEKRIYLLLRARDFSTLRSLRSPRKKEDFRALRRLRTLRKT